MNSQGQRPPQSKAGRSGKIVFCRLIWVSVFPSLSWVPTDTQRKVLGGSGRRQWHLRRVGRQRHSILRCSGWRGLRSKGSCEQEGQVEAADARFHYGQHSWEGHSEADACRRSHHAQADGATSQEGQVEHTPRNLAEPCVWSHGHMPARQRRDARNCRERTGANHAAFASWPQDSVHMLVCKVGSTSGQFGRWQICKADYHGLAQGRPRGREGPVYPDLQDLVEKLQKEDEEEIPNLLAKQILRKLAQVAADVESWYEQQGGDDAAATVAKWTPWIQRCLKKCPLQLETLDSKNVWRLHVDSVWSSFNKKFQLQSSTSESKTSEVVATVQSPLKWLWI